MSTLFEEIFFRRSEDLDFAIYSQVRHTRPAGYDTRLARPVRSAKVS